MTIWGRPTQFPSASALIPHAQRRDEGFLRDLHGPIFAHPLLALFLLLQQLLLAGDVAAIAFRGHVLAHRRDGLAGDHLAADRSLDRDLEQDRKSTRLNSSH